MADQKPVDSQSSEFSRPQVNIKQYLYYTRVPVNYVVRFSLLQDPKDVEKAQEECMKKQYQMKSNWPPVSGHSALLQKRLAKGVWIL